MKLNSHEKCTLVNGVRMPANVSFNAHSVKVNPREIKKKTKRTPQVVENMSVIVQKLKQ